MSVRVDETKIASACVREAFEYYKRSELSQTDHVRTLPDSTTPRFHWTLATLSPFWKKLGWFQEMINISNCTQFDYLSSLIHSKLSKVSIKKPEILLS